MFVPDMQIDQGTQRAPLAVLPPGRPDFKATTATTIDAADYVKYIEDYGPTLHVGNTVLISAGTHVVLRLTDWADTPKTKRQVMAQLRSAYKETARSSKQYEFAGLAFRIAQNPEAKALAAEAVRVGSTAESAIQHLAAKFQELASSTAELARYFGTARSSGQREPRRGASFSKWLCKAVEKALRAGASIDVVESMSALSSDASGADLLRITKRLLPQIGDDGLRELSQMISRTLAHREARDRCSSPRCVELTMDVAPQ
jgi:hypothetical protein